MRNYAIHDGELYHYGVLGMKWGVRKTQAQLDMERSIRGELQAAKKKLETANAEVMKNTRFGRILIGQRRDKAKQAYRDAQKYSEEVTVLKERQNINNKLSNFGTNQNAVLSERNTALSGDKVFADKWTAAFKAGKESKEWSAYEQYVKDFNQKYADVYMDAWMKDNHIKKLSDNGRRFLHDNLDFLN